MINFNYTINNFHSFHQKFILNIFETAIPIENILDLSYNDPLTISYWNIFKNYNPNNSHLYIFNSHDIFTFMSGTILPSHVEYITHFFNNANYIIFSYEVITNIRLDQIGLYISPYNHIKTSGVKLMSLDVFNEAKRLINEDKEQYIVNNYYFLSNYNELILTNNFINNILHNIRLLFYKKAKYIITSISKNVEYFKLNNFSNVYYNLPTSYSIINNYTPIYNKTYIYDVVFYGSMFTDYRNNMLKKINEFCCMNNIIYYQSDNLYGSRKHSILNHSKIVIHIPSHDLLEHFPWQKVSELMAKKIFFIIEENEELYKLNLNKTVIFYKKNNEYDLANKIQYYLLNEDKRDIVTNDCFDFIYTHYNSDKFVETILKDTVINAVDM